MKILSLCLALSAFLFVIPPAQAAFSPVAISILPPVQFPPEDFSIAGARVSALWGEHRNVYGFDIGGLGNITEQTFAGVAVSGVFNITRGYTTAVGLQAAGIANVNANKTGVYGVQLALVNANEAESTVAGLQLGALANLSPHTNIYGFQVGVYNKALEVNGFQIGVINVADTVRGLQIGLLNFNAKGVFVVSPILNFGF